MNTESHQLKIVNEKGEELERFDAPSGFPDNVLPGEMVRIYRPGKPVEEYMYCDKGRAWNGSKWVVEGGIQYVPPGKTYQELLEMRREILRFYGWT
jgi:hypothetical protein